jgi:hypothetical protein
MNILRLIFEVPKIIEKIYFIFKDGLTYVNTLRHLNVRVFPC